MVGGSPAADPAERLTRELLKRHGHRLRALAQGLLDDDLAGEMADVVCEALAQTVVSVLNGKVRHVACRNIEQSTPSELAEVVQEARAYLCKTAVWICYRKNRKKRPLLVEHAGEEVAGREPEPLDVIIAAETRSEVWAGLKALLVIDQQILVLRFLEDLSYLEIADTLGIPLGTVKSRINRACKRARQSRAFEKAHAMVRDDDAPKRG